MSNADHAATLTELLGLVDERYQSALHAGIARLSPAGLTPSPRQRAEALVASGPMAVNSEWWVNAITTAIQAASNEQLERGRKRTAEAQAALQAALEELEMVKRREHEGHIQVGHASAALSRVLLHVTGCSDGEFDTYMETAERIIEHLNDDAQCRDEVAAAFRQTTDELMALTKERDGLAADLIKAAKLGLVWTPIEQFKKPIYAVNILVITTSGRIRLLRTLPQEYSYEFRDEGETYYARKLFTHFAYLPAVPGSDAEAWLQSKMAAHDRQVAARVLLERAPYLENQGSSLLYRTAGEYEDGEREVPGE